MAETGTVLRYGPVEHRAQSDAPRWRINVSHILVDTEQFARQIIAWIEETHPDNQHACFENLAAMYSTCGSCLSYGNIGWIEPGQTDASFEQAVCRLRPNEWTQEPVQTSWGWHVIARVQ
jgi:peptidyl-prolyl cis-trans isomerase C